MLGGTATVVPILSEVTHPPPGLPIPQYNIGDYMGQHAWSSNMIVSAINPPIEVHTFHKITVDIIYTNN